jgi:hypothetical protein
MNIPGFTAEAALYKTDGEFCFSVQSANLAANAVTPAIPFCGNCDYILDNCERNGWRPRALCTMCATGNCFKGVERPPQLLDPFGHHPGGF